MLERAWAGLTIRNHSNLGPLATPDAPLNPRLFGDDDITQLEIECAKNWKNLLDHGATAHCIVSLSDGIALSKYGVEDTINRLRTLKGNIVHYRTKVEVVDIGPPFDNNIDIYGTECCLKSEKFMLNTKSYSQLRVVRDFDEIRYEIGSFDRKFSELKLSNLSEASRLFPDGPRDELALLHKYITYLIDKRIASLELGSVGGAGWAS